MKRKVYEEESKEEGMKMLWKFDKWRKKKKAGKREGSSVKKKKRNLAIWIWQVKKIKGNIKRAKKGDLCKINKGQRYKN